MITAPMKRAMPRILLLLVGLALLTAISGCTAVDAINRASETQDVFEIRAPADLPNRGSARDIDFIIEAPVASGVVDTDRILIRPGGAQVQYLPSVRWSETAPLMLQTAMVEGFERVNAFRFVGRRPLGSAGDVTLISNLTNFHAEILPESEAAIVRITLVARLILEEDTSVLAHRTFSAEAPVGSTSGRAIVQTYETLAQAMLRDLVAWTLAQRGGMVPRS